MKYSQIQTMISDRIEAARAVQDGKLAAAGAYHPLFIWGPVGTGKSSLVKYCTDQADVPMIDLRLSLLNAVDLRGLPVPDLEEKIVHWLIATFLPSLERHGPYGVLFLDEINTAAADVQNAGLQLALDRALGEYDMPLGWCIIAAGNRTEDKVHVQRMSAALNNRFDHVVMEPMLDEWSAWAAQQHDVPVELVMFLNFRPELLHAFDPANKAPSFPTPRTWTRVGQKLSAHRALGRPVDSFIHEASASVGDGPGAELLGFLRLADVMPNPDDVIANPGKAPTFPDQPDVLFALTGALIDRFRKSAEGADRDRIGEALMAYANLIAVEISVVLVQSCSAIDSDAIRCKALTEWATRNQDVILP